MTEEPVPVAAPRRVPLNNPANMLTAVRIVLVPVFVVFTAISETAGTGWRIAACLTFCVASATDFADGWIARRYQLVTSFGKVADPIADKALTGSALILLSAYDRLSWWVTGLILLREWGVTALRFWVIRYGIIPASRGGKLKTALQILAIAWLLWPVPAPFDAVGTWLMVAALLITMVTGADYVLQALRIRREALSRPGD
ncbi:CDP-diacylglycerol--glycerol-3-phosphate 3-phosphatidyltransferase [Couchioplanes caeruleus]|uniref:CDP-diacylglycerol--glycerol-3-phosphate 3-phosphatidyltransferase n=2 Tax=Couchioplanes caeruleus TaxID=56438 RepID=A0A1K0FQM3_9ACTN|nr:CDP-diacylglycerol--glycerol-3-phosphate 3-phosphatidyltransferase [Couchioplanes caeruleus]OJF15125.1 CDP-diacylglycerol--glycerol-3-phosphate 3-phosphatidyltransferase [Couchioplanes caeruleus subsp. caeruleus]ROP32605.1 CDP-diacylglycerol--glycerol-3-phosphate 3-phosphatidyltransferase [Couchioplanes caeruleus]